MACTEGIGYEQTSVLVQREGDEYTASHMGRELARGTVEEMIYFAQHMRVGLPAWLVRHGRPLSARRIVMRKMRCDDTA